jgi:hypothetical protein
MLSFVNVNRVQTIVMGRCRSTGRVSVLDESCITETVHQARYRRFVWHRRIRKCVPKLTVAS